MYEIELKAHVDDWKATEERLMSFARFVGRVQKDDAYWVIFKDGKKIQARIRRESDGTDGETKTFLTYKKKESRVDGGGTVYEVNDEKECTVSDAAVLESLFSDIGMKVDIRKQKKITGFQAGEAHIELCSVPPLGDFIEIEILSEKNDELTIAEKRVTLIEILGRCGIPKDKIESRYYSEMLRERGLKS